MVGHPDRQAVQTGRAEQVDGAVGGARQHEGSGAGPKPLCTLPGARVDPHRPLSEQGDTLWWGSGYFNAIDEPFDGFDTVVRGYDPQHGGVNVTRHAVTVDDRCGFGGPLKAACFGLDGRVIEWLEA